MRKSSLNQKTNKETQPVDREPLINSVRVRKIRFHDEVLQESQPTYRKQIVPHRPLARDAVQRLKNYEEFKRVYEERMKRQSKQTLPIQQSKSGSIFKFSTLNKDPKHIETVNIQMPLKLGSGSAIINVGTGSSIKMVSQSILTENIPKKVEHFSVEVGPGDFTKTQDLINNKSDNNGTRKKPNNINNDNNKGDNRSIPKKPSDDNDSIDKAQEILTNLKQRTSQIQNHVTRRDRLSKALPRLAVKKHVTRSPREKDKIWSALTNINEKLQKMQQKYFEKPKFKYKSMHDSFTQSSNVEVLYENKCKVSKTDSDHKQYPKIKDALTEIEAHLEEIANMDIQVNGGFKPKSSITYDGRFEGEVPGYRGVSSNKESCYSTEDKTKYSSDMRSVFDRECEETAKDIVRNVKETRSRKMKAMRQDIASVEDVLDKISHITDSDAKFSSDSLNNSTENVKKYNLSQAKNAEDFLNASQIPREFINTTDHPSPQKRDYTCSDYSINSKTQQTKCLSESEDEEIPTCIKKSFYLSKEFNTNSNVKVFREDSRKFLRERQKFMSRNSKTSYGSEESISKLINNLRVSMGNTLYTPVCPDLKKL